MNNIRIAILLNTSWYIYNFRKNLIKAMISKGYQVIAIAPKDDYSQKLIDLGCEYHELDFDSKSKNPLTDLLLIKRINKKLKEVSPDLLLNFTIKPNVYGTLAASRLKIPCINNIAGMGTLFSGNFISKILFKTLFKISQRNASTVFFQNPDDYKELTESNIVEEKKSKLLPGSGVDLLNFKYTPAQSTDSRIIFLLVARMIYPKGIKELIEATQLLRDKGYHNLEVHLLGETGVNNPTAIPKQVFDEYCNKEFVTYLGKTDNVLPYIQDASAVVLPSYYREGTPRSLLESLAVGRPIITTNMPGCKETITHGVNGFICKPESTNDLAIQLEKFIKLDPNAKLLMGEESRKLAETKFDEKIVISKYLEEINKILIIKSTYSQSSN